MGQLTIYLPDVVVATLRRDAKKARKSLSALVAERLAPPEQAKDYQATLERLCGSWKGDFPEPRELPLRGVSSLD
jgi:hypothetical protein